MIVFWNFPIEGPFEVAEVKVWVWILRFWPQKMFTDSEKTVFIPQNYILLSRLHPTLPSGSLHWRPIDCCWCCKWRCWGCWLLTESRRLFGLQTNIKYQFWKNKLRKKETLSSWTLLAIFVFTFGRDCYCIQQSRPNVKTNMAESVQLDRVSFFRSLLLSKLLL